MLASHAKQVESPFQLSLGGFMNFGENIQRTASLGHYSYPTLPRAVVVGEAFVDQPGDPDFLDFKEQQKQLIKNGKGYVTAIGLTVVRLLITPLQLEEVARADSIEPNKIYGIDLDLYAYDFARAKEGETLMHFGLPPK